MASLSNDNGLRRILVVIDGKRQAIRLGRVPLKKARTILGHVEALVNARGGYSLPETTTTWLGEQDDTLRARLALLGLVAAKVQATLTLGQLVDAYKARPKWQTLKPNSVRNETQHAATMLDHFGSDRALGDISEADAEDYFGRLRLAKGKGGRGFSKSTAQAACSAAHRLYRFAIKSRLVDRSPFEAAPRGSASRGANAYLSTADSLKVLDCLPDTEWRLLFALARWGGLRVPSEPRGLRWSDVDWERNRLLVHSPKTERHDGHATRWVPLFPEIRTLLEERFEDAREGDTLVLPVMARRDSHASTVRYAARVAGVDRWSRLWHSLRSTRQTELEQIYPSYVVCAWLGNSEAIARRHYLQVTDEHFEKAAQNSAQTASASERTVAKS